ncbi:BREX system ATP-binding domain-containing protein [Streptosporangium sp. KLBMP 9127]|nr:ATP-binding protein [Streptosporangium sp. KLBMP 9127]
MNDPKNPFPPTPVVVPDDFRRLKTVWTDALNVSRTYVQAYLQAGGARTRTDLRSGGSGICVAVSGEFGAGKSHLLRILTGDVAHLPPPTSGAFVPHVFSTVSSPVRFLSVYRQQLIGELDVQRFPKVVEFHLAAATAQVLTGLNAPEDLISAVREGTVAAAEVASHYRLSEHDISRAMREELRRVTYSDDVATHLALLDLTEKPHAVWEWLSGKFPDQTLVERGIDEPIDDDIKAFNAFATLTFLYGRAGEPFVLLIDEVEKLLQDPVNSASWRTENLQALEKLVNVFIDTGGLVVFCALPESLRRFSAGFHQRLRVLSLDPFNADQAKALIEQYLPADSPVVFPNDVVKTIVELSNGNPRLILELCDGSWKSTFRPGARTEVEAATVRAAIRAKFEMSRTSLVLGEVRQVLETGGWVHLPEDDDAFRVPAAADGAAVTVIVTDSLLGNEDTRRILRRIDAVLARKGGQEVILVVNGYLHPADRRQVAGRISRQPLTFDHHGFRERLREQMIEARRRLDDAGREGVLDSIRDEVLRVSVQQSYTHSMLERLAGNVGRAQAAPGGEAAERSRAMDRLPERVRRRFDRALSALRTLSGVESLYDGVFATSPLPALNTQPGLSRDLFQTVGIAIVFQRLVETFMEAVIRWYDQVGPRERGDLTPPQIHELEVICERYEINADYFPLFRLVDGSGGGESSALTDQVVASAQQRELVEALDGLGVKVESDLLDQVRSPLR